MEDVCFPLFHCFFGMCVIPKSLLKFHLLVAIREGYKIRGCLLSVHSTSHMWSNDQIFQEWQPQITDWEIVVDSR